jgi:hypothetical protein
VSALAKHFGLSKEVLLLLLLGIVIRIPVLVSPISEGYRNAQTAALTANMIENGKLRFDPIAPWRGDLDARLVLEFPAYNLLVLAVDAIPGVPLDTAGRLVSLVLWILSFIVLQFLWRWILPSGARLWANLLFVLAPLNWYAGAAFMPETLVQLLSITFILLCLVYTKHKNLGVCAGLILVAGLGLLVKFPAFVHLGLFAALVWIDRLGWRSLFRPALLAGALLLVGSLVAWGRYADSVNSLHFDYWTGLRNLEGFIQVDRSRLSASYWLPLLAYNTTLLLGVVGAPLAVLGFWCTLKQAPNCFGPRVLLYLLASLFAYWIAWSKAAPAQSYYNLPNTVFLAAMFGLGCNWVTRWMEQKEATLWFRRSLAVIFVALLFAFSAACWQYLYQPDRVTVAVASWLRDNTQAQDLVILQPRHNPAAMDYEHQPLLSHAAGRKTWIWTRTTPEGERARALRTSRYIVVTHPSRESGMFERIRQAIKGPTPIAPEAIDKSHPGLLAEILSGEDYTIFDFKNPTPH